jgi:glycosyltransferase involved in cell wall biosynthesis
MGQREASLAVRLHTVLACRNRRDLTVRAISTFAGTAALAGVGDRLIIFDDGSTDGTVEALSALDLPVPRIAGDSSAFMARSMAEAEARVLGVRHDGYVASLNDDVELDGGGGSDGRDAGPEVHREMKGFSRGERNADAS